MSMASAEAAEARRKAATTIDYYNLQLGPTAWNFSSGLESDYISNVHYTEDNPEGDIILRPQINTRMRWPVSDQNSINLALGGGYSAYVNNSTLDQIFINPGSELSFDLYVGEFWINLHDRITITENTYQNASLAGSGDYSQLMNVLGLTPVWDLNKTIVRASYDHVNWESIGTGNTGQNMWIQPSGNSEVFSTSAGYALRPGTLLGVEMGASLVTFSATTTNTYYPSANQWNAGGFYDTPVSEYIHFTAHAGYTAYSPQSSAAITSSSDSSGVYVQLDMRHRVNEYVEYSLSAGRSIGVVSYGSAVDRYFAQWQASWRILRKVTLGTSFVYEHGTQLSGWSETYDQYGPGISFSRPITAKLTSSLGYQLYSRNSDMPGRKYTTSIVSLNLNYTF